MKKYMLLVLVFLLMISVNVMVFANYTSEEIGELEDGSKIYVEKDTLGRGAGNITQKIIWDHDPGYGYGTGIITIEGVGYAYCTQPKLQYPTGNIYDSGTLSNDKGIQAILAYGFPNDIGSERSKYSFSDSQAYVKTFVALNTYLGKFNRTTVTNAKDPYVNYLLAKGDAQFVPKTTVKVIEPSKKNTYYNKQLDRNETDFYSLEGGDSFVVSNLPKGVFIELENKKQLVNNDKILSKQKFKFVTSTQYFGKVSPVFTSTNKNFATYVYKSPGVQTLVANKKNQSVVSNNTSFEFKKEKLDSKLVVNKFDDFDNKVANVLYDVATDAEFTDVIGKLTTDENGVASLNIPIFQNETKTIYLKEVSAPSKYVVDQEIYEVKIKALEEKVLKFTNTTKKSNLEIRKIDSTSLGFVENATLLLEVFDDEQWIEYGTYLTGDEVLKIEELHYGKYRLSEVKAPSGYALSEEIIEFEVTGESEVVEIEFTNDKVLVETGKTQYASAAFLFLSLLVFCKFIYIKGSKKKYIS